jgi:cytochrome c biogenesis protein CcmG, thiol:disulfide interchange protein DsbE
MKTLLFLAFIYTQPAFSQSVKFSLEDTQSNTRTYEELKGEKLTVVDFWATWCKPCLQSIPHLTSIQEEYKTKGVNFVGISVDGPRSVSKVGPLAKSLKINYPILLDFNNDLMRQYNVANVPSLAIIDSKNKIVYFHEGYNSGDEKKLKAKIEELLNRK